MYGKICVLDEVDEKSPIYEINGKNSIKEAVESFLKEQENKEDVQWHEGNPSG